METPMIKKLVMAVIINIIAFITIPTIIIKTGYYYLEQNIGSLPIEVYQFEDTLTLIVGLVICFMQIVCIVVWSKIFTFDKMPFAKTKRGHSRWIGLLCIVSAYVGFWVANRLFGFW